MGPPSNEESVKACNDFRSANKEARRSGFITVVYYDRELRGLKRQECKMSADLSKRVKLKVVKEWL